MPRKIRLAFAIAALLIACSAVTQAVDLHNVLVDYSVTSWRAADGAPAGTIWSLAQDREGYLWIGGDFGLLRFDGVRFVSWDALGHSPLPHGPIRWLCTSRDGSLWVGFDGSGGISRLHDDVVSHYGEPDGLPPSPVTSLLEDLSGTIWAATGSGLYHYSEHRWAAWQAHDAVAGQRILAASVGPSGALFVVTDTGVFRHTEGHEAFQLLERSNSSDLARSIAEDAFGRPYVTDRIVGFRQVGRPRPSESHVESGKGQRFLADRLGNLWVATFGQGLWRVRIDRAREPTIERATDLIGLSSNVIYSLLEDRDGNIWAGTTDGLSRLTPHRLTQITNLGLVTGLEPTRDGNMWAATADGLMQLARRGGTWQKQIELRGLRPDAMAAEADGALWVAAGNTLLRFPRGSISPVVISDQLRHVKSIAVDSHGGAWVYDSDRGLLRWHRGRLDVVGLPAPVHGARISALSVDHAGRLWIGFAQGQIAVGNGTNEFQVVGNGNTPDVGSIRAFHEDRDGMLWIGGSRGLGRFTDGRFVTLPRTNNFPTESVTGIMDDDADGLWFGTASGIVGINRIQLGRTDMRSAEQIPYILLNSSDGVAGTTGWNGQRSAARSQNGDIWFLTDRGITILDPRTLRQDPHPPISSVRIDSVAVNERRSPTSTAMQLSPNVTRLEIDYTVPDLTGPRRTRFRYRLEGFDADWIDAGTARRAMYTNLAPRAYRFRVEANDQRGTWTGVAAVWDFSVRPAFHQTTWFLAACVTGLGLATWSVWRLRLRQVHRQFGLLLGERVRLSREIHDTLLQSLVGIALQLDILEHDLDDSSANRTRFVLRMRKQLEEYIREARQSIWNLRSSTLQQCDLTTALRQYGERASEHGIAFTVTEKGTPHKCSSQVEEQILRIGQEAILNAIRHSHAHEIRVELEYGGQSLTLRVSDDGRGFDPAQTADQVTGHWGVLTMTERAKTVGGEFRIQSRDGHGTEIETVVPASI